MKSILVIDKNIVRRDALVASISSTFPDAAIFTSDDGFKGLQLASELQPDLIFLEGELSGLNSFQTAKVLRHLPETRSIPLIGFTGDQQASEDEAIGFQATCNAWLTSPISANAILRAIASVHDAAFDLLPAPDNYYFRGRVGTS